MSLGSFSPPSRAGPPWDLVSSRQAFALSMLDCISRRQPTGLIASFDEWVSEMSLRMVLTPDDPMKQLTLGYAEHMSFAEVDMANSEDGGNRPHPTGHDRSRLDHIYFMVVILNEGVGSARMWEALDRIYEPFEVIEMSNIAHQAMVPEVFADGYPSGKKSPLAMQLIQRGENLHPSACTKAVGDAMNERNNTTAVFQAVHKNQVDTLERFFLAGANVWHTSAGHHPAGFNGLQVGGHVVEASCFQVWLTMVESDQEKKQAMIHRMSLVNKRSKELPAFWHLLEALSPKKSNEGLDQGFLQIPLMAVDEASSYITLLNEAKGSTSFLECTLANSSLFRTLCIWRSPGLGRCLCAMGEGRTKRGAKAESAMALVKGSWDLAAQPAALQAHLSNWQESQKSFWEDLGAPFTIAAHHMPPWCNAVAPGASHPWQAEVKGPAPKIMDPPTYEECLTLRKEAQDVDAIMASQMATLNAKATDLKQQAPEAISSELPSEPPDLVEPSETESLSDEDWRTGLDSLRMEHGQLLAQLQPLEEQNELLRQENERQRCQIEELRRQLLSRAILEHAFSRAP